VTGNGHARFLGGRAAATLLLLPGKAVHTGTEESKKPNGEGKQVFYGKDGKVHEMRTADTILNIIQDRGKRKLPLDDVYRPLYNPDMYLRGYARIYKNAGAISASDQPA